MNQHDAAINLLAEGFKTRLAEYLEADDRFTDLLMDICMEFVEAEIPIVKEEDMVDLAAQLMMKIRVIA